MIITASGASGIDDGTFSSATYAYLNYITHDSMGNLYVSDHSTAGSLNVDSIRRLSVRNGNVTTMAGKTRKFLYPILFHFYFFNPSGTWCYGVGVTPYTSIQSPSPLWPPKIQTGRIAQFNQHTGLAVTAAGNLMYVADYGQNLIRQLYCADGKIVK